MKQRVISGAVGILLLIIVLCFYNTPVLTATLALISGIAVYEILFSTHYLTSKTGSILCAFFAGYSIFALTCGKNLYPLMLLTFLTVMIACTLKFHRSFSFQQFTVCLFAVIAIPLAFSSVLRMEEIIYLILTCIAAWVTDTGAYFAGRAFGKKKMAPYISPNKTVGGAIGGLLCTGIIFPLVCYGYWHFTNSPAEFSIIRAGLTGILCGLSGMAGDLFASVIKRETGIKDFGKIMPGHGGVMDRFDSFLFTAPTLYCLTQLFPIFK